MGAQRIIVAGLLGVVAIVAPIPLRSAQQTPSLADALRPSFEVASVKQSQSLDAGGFVRFPPLGQVTARNAALRSLITIAHNLKGFQLIGAPSWIADARFDINAKPDGNPSREQVLLMLQSLLAERFKLSGHRETRELDGFVLIVARAEGLGSQLRPTTVDCLTQFATTPRCAEGRISRGNFKLVGMPFSMLVDALISEIGAPIVNSTPLTGTFEVDLQWSPDVTPSSDLPSIFTALQEQLGLKLESKRVSSEVFVIDHVEQLTPD